MKLTKIRLEQGIIIRPNGTDRSYNKKARIKEGELCIICSDSEIRTEFKNDGYRNTAFRKKRIFAVKTKEQAIKEAIVVLFYFARK